MSDPAEIALHFIDEWSSGRIEAAAALLDSRAKASGAHISLTDLRHDLTTKVGALDDCKVLDVVPRGALSIVYLSFEFRRATFPARFVIKDGEVASFLFGDPNSADPFRDYPEKP